MTGQLSQLHARLLSLARDSSKGEVDHEEAAHIAAAEISDAAYPLSQRLLAGAQDGDQEAEAVLSCLLAAAQAHDVQALLGAGVLELLRVLAPLGYSSSPSVATGMLPALSRCILSSGNDALHPREAIMAICELLVSHSRGAGTRPMHVWLLMLAGELPALLARTKRGALAAACDCLPAVCCLLEEVAGVAQRSAVAAAQSAALNNNAGTPTQGAHINFANTGAAGSSVDAVDAHNSHSDAAAVREALEVAARLLTFALEHLRAAAASGPCSAQQQQRRLVQQLTAAGLRVIAAAAPPLLCCAGSMPARKPPAMLTEACTAVQRLLMQCAVMYTVAAQAPSQQQVVAAPVSANFLTWDQLFHVAAQTGTAVVNDAADNDGSDDDNEQHNVSGSQQELDGDTRPHPGPSNHPQVVGCCAGAGCMLLTLLLNTHSSACDANSSKEARQMQLRRACVQPPLDRAAAVSAVSRLCSSMFQLASLNPSSSHLTIQAALQLLLVGSRAAAGLPAAHALPAGNMPKVSNVSCMSLEQVAVSAGSWTTSAGGAGVAGSVQAAAALVEQAVRARLCIADNSSGSTTTNNPHDTVTAAVRRVLGRSPTSTVSAMRNAAINLVHCPHEALRNLAFHALSAVLDALPAQERAAALAALVQEPSEPLATLMLQRLRKEVAAAQRTDRVDSLDDSDGAAAFGGPFTLLLASQTLFRFTAGGALAVPSPSHAAATADSALQTPPPPSPPLQPEEVIGRLLDGGGDAESVAATCDVVAGALAVLRLLLLRRAGGSHPGIWPWHRTSDKPVLVAEAGAHDDGAGVTAQDQLNVEITVRGVRALTGSMLEQLQKVLPGLQAQAEKGSTAGEAAHVSGATPAVQPRAVGALPNAVVVYTSCCRLHEAVQAVCELLND